MARATQFAMETHSRPGITPERIVRALVFLAFVQTLLQYWQKMTFGNLIPVMFLYLAGILSLFTRRRQAMLSSIFSGGGLLILFAMLSEAVSFFYGSTFSILYGLILIGLFMAARLIILQIGFVQVFRAYVYAAVCCVFPILITGHRQIAAYRGGATRFSSGQLLHPNLLAFTLAGYFPAIVALALDLRPGLKRIMVGSISLVVLILIFYTGSRGALLAVLIAVFTLLVRFTIFRPVLHRIKLPRLAVFGLFLSAALVAAYLARGQHFAGMIRFVISALQLDSRQRGIRSGFSGRTSLWSLAVSRITGLQWLFGSGYRRGYVIDNGYLTVLLENGLLGCAVILGYLLRVSYWLWRETAVVSLSGWWRFRVAMLCMMMIFLLNNFTERFLLSYGNQFSLLILFMMVCRKEELLGGRYAANTLTVTHDGPPNLLASLPSTGR